MGVMGLTTFVDDHPELLSDHRLHDTRVLIDGNNLYYFLYYRYFNVNIRYGGDYDCYADSVRYYFKALLSCNIMPYVVFDGGYDMEERKLKTTIHRQHNRLKNVTALARGQKGQVLPLLANEVFRQLLNELHVPHMTCDFEADDQLAALAKNWHCPVMSNDSDFFVFDLPEGFIIFDYLDLQIQHSMPGEDPSCPAGYSYLSVQLYKLENIERAYAGLRREFLPVFATLVGNDFVEEKEFEVFFERVKLPKVRGGSQPRVSKRQQKMAGVLMWLSDRDSVEHTVTYIVNCFPDGKRKKARASLEASVKSYAEVKSHLVEYFDDEACRYKNRSKLQTYGGNPVPYWVVSGLRKAEIPVFIINTLTLHRNLLLPQVELVTEPCSFTCSHGLRVIIYSIIMTLDATLNDRPAARRKQTAGKETAVQEYHRSTSSLTCDLVEPANQLPGGSPVPYLQKIPHMSQAEREAVLWETVGLDKAVFQDVPRGLHLVLAAVCYWVRHAQPKVSVHYVCVMVACVIRLFMVSDALKANTDSDSKAGLDNESDSDNKAGLDNVSDSDNKVSLDNKSDSDNMTSLDNKSASDNKVECNNKSNKESAAENGKRISSDSKPTEILNSSDSMENVNTYDTELDKAPMDKVVTYSDPQGPDIEDVARELLQHCTVDEIKSATVNTDRFTIETRHNSTDNKFHTLITHNYSQYQTCLQSLMHLNMLLLQPLPTCHPALTYNGTFLYNLTLQLQRRDNPNRYICEQLGTTSAVSALYLKLVDTLMGAIPQGAFLSTDTRKKKKKKSKKKSAEVEEGECGEGEEDGEGRDAVVLAAKCALTNRFMDLCLEDVA